jgi:hypothetical protein
MIACRTLQNTLLALVIFASATVAARADQTSPLLIEAEVAPSEVWLHAQAQYTLRLLQAVPLDDLTLVGPDVPLAEMRPLGPDQISETTRDGTRYRVTERRFALFPFTSGTLELKGAHVKAQSPGVNGISQQRRPAIRLDAAPLVLTVRAAPAAIGSAHWLPAHKVTISDVGPTAPATLRQGEPMTRRLRLEARGVDAARVPALQFDTDNATVHAHPPRLTNYIENGLNIGVREQHFDVLPRRAGPLVLPAIELDWWNIDTNRTERSILAARELIVEPGTTSPDIAAAMPPLSIQASKPAAPDVENPASETYTEPTHFSPISLMLGTVAITLALLAAASRHTTCKRALARIRSTARLRRSCLSGSAAATRDAMIDWANAHGMPAARNLCAVSGGLKGMDTAIEIARLERHLYGCDGTKWDGTDLLAALRRDRLIRLPCRAGIPWVYRPHDPYGL